jgi:lipopolysaccharide/colanic/teichoic acid biosynthesis glycosyltransferase
MVIARPERSRSSGPAIEVGGGRWLDIIKNTADFAIAATILVLSLPVMILAYLAIRLTSRGPAFYSQLRLGQGGKPYVIYKLRSMYHNCERTSGIQWSTRGDPRVTPVGRILRKTHIDEIPQLWNVLRGEMSLIGPRPERPELVVKLEQDLPYYRDRLLVKPGLTGLAQIQLPPDTDLDSVRNKLVLDRVYVSRRSLWLDFRIYLATAFYLCGVSFPTLRQWFSLPHELFVTEAAQDDELILERRPTPIYTTVSIHN